jgi:effector-binding domain-containing protein
MVFEEAGIQHKHIPRMFFAGIRFNLKKRSELPGILQEILETVPPENIAGSAGCTIHFITGVEEGMDVTAGFPVKEPIQTDRISTVTYPAMDVLSLIHEGPLQILNRSYGTLFGTAARSSIISDEFAREIYIDLNSSLGERVELQFVIHNWEKRLKEGLETVLDTQTANRILGDTDVPGMDRSPEERFSWAVKTIEQIESTLDDDQVYDVISRCAHVFPSEQIERAHSVYKASLTGSNDKIRSVDAVLEFMSEDPVWGNESRREGDKIYTAKNPRDPEGYENATTQAQKAAAYCFCPIIQDRMDQDIPVSFCYCGAGWFRQQWEGILGEPVRIDIVKSVLKGDDVCQFAIHIPGQAA